MDLLPLWPRKVLELFGHGYQAIVTHPLEKVKLAQAIIVPQIRKSSIVDRILLIRRRLRLYKSDVVSEPFLKSLS